MERMETQYEQSDPWLEADLALRRLGEIDVQVARLEAELAEAVTRLKSEAAAKVDSLRAIRKIRERELEAFAKAHRGELAGKSVRLTHGVFGFRKGRPTVKLEWKAARIIEALKVRKLLGCIRVQERLNKDALLLLKDEQLADCGCARREGRDKFFAEPDLAQIEERPA